MKEREREIWVQERRNKGMELRKRRLHVLILLALYVKGTAKKRRACNIMLVKAKATKQKVNTAKTVRESVVK